MPKGATQYQLACRAPSCGYMRTVGSEKERDRWKRIHESTGREHSIEATEEIPLPPSPQVGDRVRLREDRREKVKEACKLAGYDLNPNAIVTVLREDMRPSGRALWFDRPPWSFYAGDVELAWSDEHERRKALREKGHDV